MRAIFQLVHVGRAIGHGGDLTAVFKTSQHGAFLDTVAVLDHHFRPGRNHVLPLDQSAVGDLDHPLLAFPIDIQQAIDLADDRLALGIARLEQLLDTRQTLSDVFAARHTAGVEGAQG